MMNFYLYICIMEPKPLELLLFLRPPPPDHLSLCLACISPSPHKAGNFEARDIWRLFDAFFGLKFSGNFGTRDTIPRDYTRSEISGKFWDGPSQIFQEILARVCFIISR